MIRSHDKKSQWLGHKLRSETSKSKAGQGGLVRVALFTNLTLDETCIPVCVILYHMARSCKGPIKVEI